MTISEGRTEALGEIAPYCIVRTAGMAPEALAGLRSQAFLELAEALDRIEADLGELSTSLCADLHALAEGDADKASRQATIELKRSVYNNRAPSARTRASPAWSSERISARLASWKESIERRENLLRDSAEALRSDDTRLGRALLDLWRDPKLQLAILLAQPELHREIQASVPSPQDRPTLDRRRRETLLAYAHRMLTKTSPFGSFAPIAAVPVADLPDASTEPVRWVSDVQFDASLYSGIESALLDDEDLRKQLPLHAAPLLRREGAEATVLASGSGPGGGESLRSVHCPPAALAILDAAECLPSASAEGLAHELAAMWPHGADKWRGVIDTLLEAGLLRHGFGYEPARPEALSKLHRLIERLSGPRAEAISNALGRIREAIGQLSRAPAKEAPRLVEAIRKEAELAAPGARIPACPVRHSQYMRTGWTFPTEAAAVLAPALGAIAGLAPLFCADRPTRKLLRRALVPALEASGGRIHLISAYEHFLEAAEEGTSADPLAAARDEFVRELRAIAEGPSPGSAMLDEAFLERWTSRAGSKPEATRPSLSFMGMLLDDAGGPRFVLERITAGSGTFIVPHLGPASGGKEGWLRQALMEKIETLDPPSEPVELFGHFGFTGQTRPPLTKRQLVNPAEARDATRIWDDIEVALDETRGRPILRSRSTGRPVLPVHGGAVSPIHFDGFYAFVALFGPPFGYAVDFPELIAADEEGPPGIRHYRRVCCGPVTLSREMWSVPVSGIPAKSGDPFDDYRRLRRWASDSGFPARCFVTPMTKSAWLRGAKPGASFSRLHKPFFVDWDALAGHRLFRRFTRGAEDRIVVAEALPFGDQWPLGPLGDRRPLEIILEYWGGEARRG